MVRVTLNVVNNVPDNKETEPVDMTGFVIKAAVEKV